MKRAALLLIVLLAPSCAHPLETLADQKHQARIDASNAGLPLSSGAADGLGGYIAQTYSAPAQPPKGNP